MIEQECVLKDDSVLEKLRPEFGSNHSSALALTVLHMGSDAA